PQDSALDVLGAVALEPDGLVFQVPATLTLKLALPEPAGLIMRFGQAYGSPPSEFGDSGALLTADSSGLTATGQIYGFSGKCAMKNCHAGTRDSLVEAWNGVDGRDRDCLSLVTGIKADDLTTCQLGSDPLTDLLAPFFDVCGDFPPG